MKGLVKIVALVLALAPTLAFAQSSTSQNTPGHEMQDKGPKKGSPGASGYSPGHEMQDKGPKKGYPGASGYAPGHQDDTRGSR